MAEEGAASLGAQEAVLPLVSTGVPAMRLAPGSKCRAARGGAGVLPRVSGSLGHCGLERVPSRSLEIQGLASPRPLVTEAHPSKRLPKFLLGPWIWPALWEPLPNLHC